MSKEKVVIGGVALIGAYILLSGSGDDGSSGGFGGSAGTVEEDIEAVLGGEGININIPAFTLPDTVYGPPDTGFTPAPKKIETIPHPQPYSQPGDYSPSVLAVPSKKSSTPGRVYTLPFVGGVVNAFSGMTKSIFEGKTPGYTAPQIPSSRSMGSATIPSPESMGVTKKANVSAPAAAPWTTQRKPPVATTKTGWAKYGFVR